MSCKTCPIRNFVHSVLYCQGCPDKPKPKITTGTAYLFLKNKFRPVTCADVKATAGLEYETAAVELAHKLKIEFIESNGVE